MPLRVLRVTSDRGDTAIGVRLNVNGLWCARFGLGASRQGCAEKDGAGESQWRRHRAGISPLPAAEPARGSRLDQQNSIERASVYHRRAPLVAEATTPLRIVFAELHGTRVRGERRSTTRRGSHNDTVRAPPIESPAPTVPSVTSPVNEPCRISGIADDWYKPNARRRGSRSPASGSLSSSVAQFALDRREEAFHHRVVVTIATAAHAAGDATRVQDRLIVLARVRTALVGVIQQPRRTPRSKRFFPRAAKTPS